MVGAVRRKIDADRYTPRGREGQSLESESAWTGARDAVSGWAFIMVLILVGVAASGCVVLARRNARWRRAALGGAVLLSFAAMEASAIYLDVHNVLEP
jgi:hypothetical protein